MLCLCNYTNSFRKYKRRAVFSKSLFVSQASFHAYFLLDFVKMWVFRGFWIGFCIGFHLLRKAENAVTAAGIQGLFQSAARLYFRGSLRMEVAPVGIELHGIIIDARIIAHAAATPQYHLLQRAPSSLRPAFVYPDSSPRCTTVRLRILPSASRQLSERR